MSWNPSDPFGDDQSEETLPNGHTRQEYKDLGFSDHDIEFWGLDQTGAPSPQSAGWVLDDMMDGDFDGEIDF